MGGVRQCPVECQLVVPTEVEPGVVRRIPPRRTRQVAPGSAADGVPPCRVLDVPDGINATR